MTPGSLFDLIDDGGRSMPLRPLATSIETVALGDPGRCLTCAATLAYSDARSGGAFRVGGERLALLCPTCSASYGGPRV
jgi:hypothetical protein